MASHKNGRKDGANVNGGYTHSKSAAAPDLNRYRVHLAHMALSPDREEQILLAIWRIMGSFVDRAWGDDPVQHVVDPRNKLLDSPEREMEE